MAKLVYSLSQSLDGYVDHMKLGPPAPAAFRHFIELVRGLTGLIYGRRMYEIMQYWDDDLPDWDAEDREFAAAYRSRPKWVVSRSEERRVGKECRSRWSPGRQEKKTGGSG